MEKRYSGRPRSRWEDNIKMDLKVIVMLGTLWKLAKDRDQWRDYIRSVINLQ